MKRGAVAILDFLGQKGIWEKYPAESILRDMERLQDIVEEHKNIGNEYLRSQHSLGAPEMELESIFISDTIFLFCWYKSENNVSLCPLVYILGKVAAELIREAALVEIPRTLRGCISIGDFDFRRNFLIGEAVDKAAECYETADGVFTFLDNSAQRCFEEARKLEGFLTDEEIKLFIENETPIKKRPLVKIPTLNPLIGETESEQKKIVDRIIKSFNNDDDSVQRKKKNIEDFLIKCIGL
jgi:hypothetical protein